MREVICPLGSAFLLLLGLSGTLLPAQDDLEVWRARYRRVEAELREIAPDGLTPEQARARATALDALAEYSGAGVFGIDRSGIERRVPLFVDDGGRRCALAFLLERSGEQLLVDEIARTRNGAWLVELTDEPRLVAWLARSGLTAVEAARIQGPGAGMPRFWRRPAPPPPPPPPWTGPEDATASARGGSFGRPAAAPAPRAGRPAPATPMAAPRGAPMTPLPAPEWETYWESAREGFLVDAVAPGAADFDATAPRRARTELAPRLAALLEHPDAGLRRAAAQALGNLRAGAPALLAAVEDAQIGVRLQAIVALGARRTSAGADVLARLIRADAGHRDQLAPVALIAMGLGGVALDQPARHAVTAPESDASVRLAALVMGELLDADWLEDAAVAELQAEDLALSCRAAEALGRVSTTRAVAALTRAASGPIRELRRSAAAGLGRSAHALALPALQTAYDLEREQLTRANLLLAIGRHAEPAARAFLLAELGTTQKALRCFAALALAHTLRPQAEDADAARAALRAAFAAERNHSAHGAYLIALGLARDRGALDLLAEQLAHGVPAVRMAAAEGLALLGGDAAAERLQRRLRQEECPIVRCTIADGLGAIGIESDLAEIVRVLGAEQHVEAASALALALGRRYSAVGLEALQALAFDDAREVAVRAAAVVGLGTMLREPPSRRLVELVRDANWRALPPWLSELLASAL